MTSSGFWRTGLPSSLDKSQHGCMGVLRKRCKTYGCPNLHHNVSGYCDECTARWKAAHRTGDTRPSASARGYGWEWTRFAKAFLQEHPVCEMCGRPATCVDHKDIPADVMMEVWGQFDLDPSHYQALCSACNASKGAREDRDTRRRWQEDRRRLDAMAGACGPQGEGQKNRTPGKTGPV